MMRNLAGAILLLVPGALPAQMLTYLRGLAATPNSHVGAPAYELEYRQGIYHEFAGSFAYINEGHFPGHHRDGYGLQIWYNIPVLPQQKLSIAAGLGPYYYFDTITPAGGPSADIHGTAVLVSLMARGELGHRFYWMAEASRINPTADFKTNVLAVGVGYWLGKDAAVPQKNLPGIFEPAKPPDEARADELSVYGVLSVINISSNPHAFGGSVEYRHRFVRDLYGTVTYIYEGDPRVARRAGFAAQLWPVRSAVLSRLEIGAGFGGYLFIDRKHQPVPGQLSAVAAAGLVSIMASYDLDHRWFVRFVWDRVISDYSRDADIWRIGLGRRL